MELKEKLVALRKEKGLTQSAVAEKLDVSRQAISRWESGIALPSTDNLKSLSALYGVPVDYLLNSDTEEQRVTKGLEAENTIKVYKGSTLVAERTGGSPDMVYARWSINLALNSNHLGTLYFYYASGAQAHHCDAKGKSGKGYTWDKEYGHTPPGDYYGETGGPSKDTEKYGPNKFIRMKGNQDPGYENLYVDGDYVTRGRSGLLIHGGRDQTSLWNTEGCVRIFDKDAKKITGLMDSWRSAGYHQFGRIKITRPGQSL